MLIFLQFNEIKDLGFFLENPGSYFWSYIFVRLIFSSRLFSVYKLPQESGSFLPKITTSDFLAIIQENGVTSVLAQSGVIQNADQVDDGWNYFYIEGNISFNQSGVLSKIISPLADRNISVLTYSTFNTDFIFFKNERRDDVIEALQQEYQIRDDCGNELNIYV